MTHLQVAGVMHECESYRRNVHNHISAAKARTVHASHAHCLMVFTVYE